MKLIEQIYSYSFLIEETSQSKTRYEMRSCFIINNFITIIDALWLQLQQKNNPTSNSESICPYSTW